MSKLYQKYVALKVQNSKVLYLFKSGIFYIFIDEDAKLMAPRLNLKLTNLNSMIVKCGFPESQLDKYINLIKNNNFNFKIIDLSDNTIYLPTEYLLNPKINILLEKISSVNAYDLSISSAYDFIDTISKESKEILGEYKKNGRKQK